MDNELEVEILQQESNDSYLQFKIIVLGNSAVGKSSLLAHLTKQKFNGLYQPTINFDFFCSCVKIDSKVIKLNLWDTCGQEEFSSLIQNYYRNTSLAFVVYAIDDKQSFDKVDLWVKELKKYSSPDIKVFLIGNKSDLSEQRVVSYEMGEELAKELDLNYFIETSAKTGMNTEELIKKGTRLLYNEYKNLISQQNLNLLSNSVMSKLYRNQNILLQDRTTNKKKCCGFI